MDVGRGWSCGDKCAEGTVTVSDMKCWLWVALLMMEGLLYTYICVLYTVFVHHSVDELAVERDADLR